jgi:DNA ligase-1
MLEVAFNNIQRSSRHESGFALRFPRILRLRPDKTPEQIDTLERVAELYVKQVTLPRSSGLTPERDSAMER